MSTNRESERGITGRKDQLFSALGLVKDLNGMVKNNQNLDRKVYEEKYQRYIRSHAATFRPEYPVVVAYEQGMYQLVGKIADPVIDILKEQKNRIIDEKERENFSVVITVIEMEKEKAKNHHN